MMFSNNFWQFQSYNNPTTVIPTVRYTQNVFISLTIFSKRLKNYLARRLFLAIQRGKMINKLIN